ncbi:MAG: glycine betaine ABC transporter substrate-binding protein [Clostridiales bacterium]|nr:glycine betaine ABC transporter substrate-binding protein [Clostridiales bacterium]MCF8022019.1 glycine betaine ABC transporter substrate-binding protein [Clostridiales bacterium]
MLSIRNIGGVIIKVFQRKALFFMVMVLVLSLAVCGCSNGSSGNDENKDISKQNKDKTIRIGANNWAENEAVSNMWKILLEEKGYDVKVVTGGNTVVYSGVASQDLDISLEVWLPKADKPSWERYKDKLDKYGPWYEKAKLGLVVPEYVDVDSIKELNVNKDKFIVNKKTSIVGIDAGANLMKLTEDCIKEYDLGYKLLSSSGPSMVASLKTAIDNKDPILVTLWNPHWVFAKYNLKYLKDPQNAYGKADDIYLITHNDFDEEFPQVVSYFKNWKMNDQTLGSLMATIKKEGKPVVGAKKWIENNRDVVNKWFK